MLMTQLCRCCEFWRINRPINNMECCGAPSSRVASTASLPQLADDVDFSGPVKTRECKDVFILMVFSVFAVYMVCVAIAAASRRDYARLTHRMDSHGNLCGLDNRHKKLFGVPLSGQDMRGKLMVEEKLDASKQRTTWECVDKCTVGPMKRTGSFRVCDSTRPGVPHHLLRNSEIEIVASDIIWRLREIAFVVLIGIGHTILWMLCLRFLAAVFVWIIMGIAAAGSLAITIALWLKWNRSVWSYITDEKEVKIASFELYKVWWIVALTIVTTLTVILIILIISISKRVQLVTTLFTEAGRALGDMPVLFIQPFITALTVTLISSLWLLGLVSILSVAHCYISDEHNDSVMFKPDDFFLTMAPFYLIFFLWLVQIVLNCQNFVVAASVSSWYFTRHKTQMSSPVLESAEFLVAYHMGSVTYGSLLLAIVEPIRALVTGAHLAVAPKVRSCLRLETCWTMCCRCLDYFPMYISKNAFIVMAVHGLSFRTSARRAQRLLARHRAQLSAIDSVADFLLFLTKLAVAVPAVFCGVWTITDSLTTVNVWVPLFAGGFISYYVADSCISVYEMTIDTLFLCFCEDNERNDGFSRPFFMSEALRDFMEESKEDLVATRITGTTP
ncbi:choline transporter-like protein 1 [Ixodes scapularis]|nr:choline transporter-like protein 1 [Ixodes scapularis]